MIIAILALLMSLLLPALQRAKYAAKLTACASNQRQILISVRDFAVNNDELLPIRTVPWETQGFPAPFALKVTDILLGNGDQSFDDRPTLTDAIELKILQCPFHPRLDLEGSAADHIRTSYSLYAGWMLAPGERKMSRLGSTMSKSGHDFDILVADMNVVYNGLNGSFFAQASHPDIGTGTMRMGTTENSTMLSSNYSLSGSIYRGPVDMNFGRPDGSVFRISDVEVDDSRLEKVDYKYGNNTVGLQTAWSLLPSVDYAE